MLVPVQNARDIVKQEKKGSSTSVEQIFDVEDRVLPRIYDQ